MKWERQFCKLTNFVSLLENPGASRQIGNYGFLSDYLPEYCCQGEWREKWTIEEEKCNEPRIAYYSHSSAHQKHRSWHENFQSAVPARSFPKARNSQGHSFCNFERGFGTELQKKRWRPTCCFLNRLRNASKEVHASCAVSVVINCHLSLLSMKRISLWTIWMVKGRAIMSRRKIQPWDLEDKARLWMACKNHGRNGYLYAWENSSVFRPPKS